MLWFAKTSQGIIMTCLGMPGSLQGSGSDRWISGRMPVVDDEGLKVEIPKALRHGNSRIPCP